MNTDKTSLLVGQNGKVMYSLRETAKLLGWSTKWVREFVYSGQLKCYRFRKRSIYFSQAHINEFLRKHEHQADVIQISKSVH